MEQWNQIKDPDINTHTDKQLIFDKEVKNIYNGGKKRKHLQQMVLA